MNLKSTVPRTLLCALLISAGAVATAWAAETPHEELNKGTINCEMKFNLRGMRAFYATSQGEGIITCNNGQRARLSVRATGGGAMFGRSEIADGTGKFVNARGIAELFGSYVPSEVHAVARGSAAVQVLTKGGILLRLAGAGRGVDFGFAFEEFTIERVN